MASRSRTQTVILGIDLSSRGFGFALFEGPNRLIDWGVKQTRKDRREKTIGHIRQLVKLYRPGVIVTDDYQTGGRRRPERVRELIQVISEVADDLRVRHHITSWFQVKATFSRWDAKTKHEIATQIAELLPELAPRVPPRRKPWMSEDYRMSIFDAVAYCLTYYQAPANSRKERQPHVPNST